MKICCQLQNENKIQKISTPTQSEKRQKIRKRLEENKALWSKKLQESIRIWVNLVQLKITNCFKFEHQKENSSQIHSLCQLQTQIKYIQQDIDQQLKKIDSILLGELTSKKQQRKHRDWRQDQHSNSGSQLFNNSKNRSGSFNMPRNRKHSMFNTDSFRQSTHTQTWKQSLNYQRICMTGTIAKQRKKKPKFEREETKKQEIDKGLTSTVQNFLQTKSVRKEKKVEQSLTNIIGQKILEVQLNLSTKLDNLMSNITQRITEINEKKVEEDLKQKDKYLEIVFKEKESLKEELLLKFKLKEEALENYRAKCFQEDHQNKPPFPSLSDKNINIIKREYDKKESKGMITQVRKNAEQPGLQKIQKQAIFRAKENNLYEFIGLKKKIKLPINDQLSRIFAWSYIKICQSSGYSPRDTYLQIKDYLQQDTFDFPIIKIELKDCLSKLKKLCGMDRIKEKADKIKLYIEQCLKCTYDLVICIQHQITEDTIAELERAISKL